MWEMTREAAVLKTLYIAIMVHVYVMITIVVQQASDDKADVVIGVTETAVRFVFAVSECDQDGRYRQALS
jgi:hypothetical protein